MVMILFILLTLTLLDARVTFEHNPNGAATREFKFKNIAPPLTDDAATNAKLTLLDGDLDQGSADLTALTDGRLPGNDDDPGGNVFFRAGSSGGRVRMDFASPLDIVRINSYSWHPSTRGPQLYKLYAAVGSEANLNLEPKRGVDPASCGWKFIALVSTIPEHGEDGGQYGVSITGSDGSLGEYRYLLFDCYMTEFYDNWGNTFYSEIDVVSAK